MELRLNAEKLLFACSSLSRATQLKLSFSSHFLISMDPFFFAYTFIVFTDFPTSVFKSSISIFSLKNHITTENFVHNTLTILGIYSFISKIQVLATTKTGLLHQETFE